MKEMKKNKRKYYAMAIAAMCAILLGGAGLHYCVETSNEDNGENVSEITSRAQESSVKVTAKGVLPDGYSLKLKEIADEGSNLKASTLMSENTTTIGSYDISITDENNKEYQPRKDKRSVSLLIENEAFKNYSDIEVCHISDSGKAEMMDVVRVRDDADMLKTDSYST